MYHYGKGDEEDDLEAAKWYRLAADQGFARAQSNLGGIYYYGYGVEQDKVEGQKWYDEACAYRPEFECEAY